MTIIIIQPIIALLVQNASFCERKTIQCWLTVQF